MAVLKFILITAILAGNLLTAADDSSESEEKSSSCGHPVLRPCACVTVNPCEIDPSSTRRNFLTAENVQKNIREHLPTESNLSEQRIKADNSNDETNLTSIDGRSTALAGDENEGSDRNVDVQVCIEGDSVQRLDILEKAVNLTSDCKQVSTEWYAYNLSRMNISKFEKGWFRLKDKNQAPPNVTVMRLEGNNIVQVTGNIMNELSENITWMDLKNNKIERLEEGCFEHERIFSLELGKNLISEIEQNVFKMPALYQLYLDENRLKDTQFVSTLPSSLVSLYLNKNEITEISTNSFSNLQKLKYLTLSDNKLTVLPNQCLLGATSISQLSFSDNQITTIEPGAFEGLHPFQIFLDGNNISSIEKGTFTATTGLRQLNMERNKFTTIEPGMFDQPHIRYLQLAKNNIKSFKKGAVEKLTQLETLDISHNPIERVENDGLSGLNERAKVKFG